MIKKIIIIGNGFDLAHNYKTDYNSFLDHLTHNFKKNMDLFAIHNLIIPNSKPIGTIDIGEKSIALKSKNDFFGSILNTRKNNNWCNIENLYFFYLKKTREIKKLNFEFEMIKIKLEKYLIENVKHTIPITSYSKFFEKNNSINTIILNFNYTNTIQKLYPKETSNSQIIHIHGQLRNPNNPIIFGYASSFEENKILLSKNNAEYLKNIKLYNYKRTNNESLLRLFLERKRSDDKLKIFVLGHSCSLSDKNILNEIFNHELTSEINILYHNQYSAFFETMVNIHRIMDSDLKFHTITNFKSSLKAPQRYDNDKLCNEFETKLETFKDVYNFRETEIR